MKKIIIICIVLQTLALHTSSTAHITNPIRLDLRLKVFFKKLPNSEKKEKLEKEITKNPSNIILITQSVKSANLDASEKMRLIYALTDKEGERTVLIKELGVKFSK
jgi:hypothetical protein